MLKLVNIIKDYPVANGFERAIKHVTIHFSKGEFVAFLGPSGSGKTTLLNLVGGLDQYTSGDLFINGVSTKNYKDADWDSYRNNHVGFIFQNHYLIDHITILENVELAMSLNGRSPSFCRQRATFLLNEVGLSSFIHKRPPFLSGGQKQRAAIARALANDPDILLADEPTGSLDSENTTIVMDLIKKIAFDKLVIMVTHNQELANQYSTRVVQLKDGSIYSDSSHQKEINLSQFRENRPSKMRFKTALHISIKNLRMRLFRTFLTAFAGSVGIIGVGLVFAGSSALDKIVETMQTNSLSGLPITINPTVNKINSPLIPANEDERDPHKIYPYDTTNITVHTNNISESFIQHLDQLATNDYTNIYYNYGLRLYSVNQNENTDAYFTQSTLNFGPISTTIDNVERQYDLLYGSFPQNTHDMVLIISEDNLVDIRILNYLNLPTDRLLDFNEIIGATIHLAKNNDYYQKNTVTERYSVQTNLAQAYDNAFVLQISGILRQKEDVWSPLFSKYGVYYTQEFVKEALLNANQSAIVFDQKNASTNILNGSSASLQNNLIALGAMETPIGLAIYTSTFAQTRKIVDHLTAYNQLQSKANKITYSNTARSMMASLDDIIATTNVSILVFALMTILVSGSMIGIISFISVFERTKEIGILRAIGARKKDIARIFNAETFLIGVFAGIIGLCFSLILCAVVNIIGKRFYPNLQRIAHLNWWQSILLIITSIILSLLAGYLPARKAANKDPVKALTT